MLVRLAELLPGDVKVSRSSPATASATRSCTRVLTEELCAEPAWSATADNIARHRLRRAETRTTAAWVRSGGRACVLLA